ncbi:hypothetical protein ACQ4P5_01215 [Ralstonia sp. L16]|uniref:hypothetical protein n=1 Tax=Ralstonia sp. L16 TaxID=3423950 RepID=UPI003F79D981
MADAAIRDVDLDVVRTGAAARDLERFERFVAGVGAIGMNLHGVFRGLFVDGEGIFFRPPKEPIAHSAGFLA